MSKTVPLELSIHFNGQLLAVVPLELPDAGTFSNRTDAPEEALESTNALSRPIRMALRLAGDPADGARHGVIEVPVCFSGPQVVTWSSGLTTSYRYDSAGARFLHGNTHTLVYDGHLRQVNDIDSLAHAMTVAYDCQGNSVDPSLPENDPPCEEPPEDLPHIVEN